MHTLTVDPRLPKAWRRYQIVFLRYGTRNAITRYEIKTENPGHVNRAIVVAKVDGAAVAKGVARIARLGDTRIHRLRVELGRRYMIESFHTDLFLTVDEAPASERGCAMPDATIRRQ